MTKLLIVLSILILPILGRAQVLDENLVSAIGLESFNFSKLVNPQEEKRQSRFIASDPNLSKPKKEKTKSVKDRAFDLITDKGVNLDIDNNGKDDFWRVYDKGRLAGIKIDANEDGFIDTYTKYNREGWVELEKLNRNFDKAYDVLRKCKAASDCITLLDNDYDNFYETKEVLKHYKGNQLIKTTFSRNSKGDKWKKVDTRYVSYFQASQGGVVFDCGGDCLAGVSDQFSTIEGLEREIRNLNYKNGRIRTTAINLESKSSLGFSTKQTYDLVDDLGILVNQNCYEKIGSDPETGKKKFLAALVETVAGMLECADTASRGFEQMARDQSNPNFLKFAKGVKSNVSAGLLALLSENSIEKRPKITCTHMGLEGYRASIKSDGSYDTSKTSSSTVMAAQRAGTEHVLLDSQGRPLEVTSGATITIHDPEYGKLLSEGDSDHFVNTMAHELVHVIMGDVHGEHEAAYACSTMCRATSRKVLPSKSRFLCAAPKDSPKSWDAWPDGVVSYFDATMDVLTDAANGPSISQIDGNNYNPAMAFYLNFYMKNFTKEDFKTLTRGSDNKGVDENLSYALEEFFSKDDPVYMNLVRGKPPSRNPYDPSDSGQLYKYIIVEVFRGRKIGSVMKEVYPEEVPTNTSNLSSAEKDKIKIFQDFILNLWASN